MAFNTATIIAIVVSAMSPSRLPVGMAPEPVASSPSPFSAVFKAYDVRGIVPDELDARSVYAIGVGFGRLRAVPA